MNYMCVMSVWVYCMCVCVHVCIYVCNLNYQLINNKMMEQIQDNTCSIIMINQIIISVHRTVEKIVGLVLNRT